MANKVALVVGASRGIGAAAARKLAADGYDIAIAASGREVKGAPSTLESVRDEIAKMTGHYVRAVQTNIVVDGAIEDLIANVMGDFGRLDVLVWAASALYPFPIGKLRPKDIALMYKISAIAPLTAVNVALPRLREHGGRIVFFAPPIYMEAAAGGGAAYIASKWSQVLCAMDVNATEQNVRADCVWPDFLVDTLATTAFPPECKRKSELVADAVGVLLGLSPAALDTACMWSESELMGLAGKTDLSSYDVVPGSNPPPLCQLMAKKGWGAGMRATHEFMATIRS